MAVCNKTIGQANVQAVFVEIENVSGELQRPTANGYILPAGSATMTQTPPTSDSEEKSRSLNKTAKFQDAVTAGDVSLPAYVRTSDTAYGAPQGDALLQALMGELQTSGQVTALLVDDILANETEMTVSDVTGGFLTLRGVVMIGAEEIHYKAKESTATNGEYILKGLTRGYRGTVAQDHTMSDSVSLVSRSYLQDICRPTVSIWIQYDHSVMFMSGCSVSSAEIPLSTTGGQMITISAQGRRMGWCGRGEVEAISGGVITLGEEGHFAYSVGGIIQNATKELDNSGAGYTITEVNKDNNTITVSPVPSGWAVDDVLTPFLPLGVTVGDNPTESRSVRLFTGDIEAVPTGNKQREGSITVNTPIEFAQEIGDEYVGESADTKRDIQMTGGFYFRADDTKKIGKGYQGYEERYDILLGDKAGKTISLTLPRMRNTTPEIGEEGSFLVLNATGEALGVADIRDNESALFITLE